LESTRYWGSSMIRSAVTVIMFSSPEFVMNSIVQKNEQSIPQMLGGNASPETERPCPLLLRGTGRDVYSANSITSLQYRSPIDMGILSAGRQSRIPQKQNARWLDERSTFNNATDLQYRPEDNQSHTRSRRAGSLI
jgi:hypothetical protein